MFGVNGVILTQIRYKLLRRQAKFPRILIENGQNDIEHKDKWPSSSIRTKNFPGFMFCTHLVIPAQICDESSCRQGKVYGRTVARSDGQGQATTIPLRTEMPWGKYYSKIYKKTKQARHKIRICIWAIFPSGFGVALCLICIHIISPLSTPVSITSRD